jgi:peptidoglycan/LPS O-acetylase OafA/YrhL
MRAATPASRSRYRALDGYRFIAASLVVLYHYNGDFGLGIECVTPLVNSLSVMVDFFFVLSGFVIALTYAEAMSNLRDYGDFLRRRLVRILPLHLAVLFTFVGLVLAFKLGLLPANHPEILDLKALPANGLLLHAWGVVGHLSFNSPSWSVSAEWLAYLVFPLFLMLSRRLSLAANLAIVIGSIAAMTLWRNAVGLREWNEATYDFGALRALPTFFLGVVCSVLLESSPRLFRAPWLAVHFLFLSAVITLHFELPRELTIALLALVVLFAAAAERNNKPSLMMTEFMAGLGDTSYAVYMIHILISAPILFVLRKTGAIGTPVAAGAALATFLAVVVVADIVYGRFEGPMRRWLSGGRSKNASVAFSNSLSARLSSPQAATARSTRSASGRA